MHVAGSKGKGSVVALVGAALQSAGLRCGTLTSPHVERVNERLHLQGTPAEDDRLAAALDAAMEARAAAAQRDSAGGEASWFDVFTAASFWALAREDVGWAVVECGLGGRNDSTNVVGADVAVLTSVELEHTEVLGTTVEEIAREKAAIVSRCGTLIAALAHGSTAAAVARCVARERGAGAVVMVPPSPDGAAASNLGTARAVLDEIGRRGVRVAATAAGGDAPSRPSVVSHVGGHLLDEPAVRAAARATLPARLESTRASCGVDVLLDGAHTPASAAALVRAVRGSAPPAAAASRRPPVLLLGLMADKDTAAVARELARLRPAHAVCTSLGSGASQPPHSVAALLLGAMPSGGCRAVAVGEPVDALAAALDAARERGTYLVVTGSLRLCGTVRSSL